MKDSKQGFTARGVPPLKIILTTDKERFSVGEQVRVAVEVRNVSDRRLCVVGVLDGSEACARYPHYTPHITGPDYRPRTPERPEYTSPLRAADFRWLNPSEAFDPTASVEGAAYLPLVCFSQFHPPLQGRYELSLTLSTDSHSNEEWLGTLPAAQDDVLPLIAQVPHLRVESNLVVIDVK